MRKILSSKWTKVALFVLSLVPLSWLVWRAVHQDLTANPIEYVTHFTGDWTLRLVLITLTVTPLRYLLNQPQITRFRRMMGLFSYFYGLLHLTIWILSKDADPHELWADILKRWYITVGMAGLLGMTPLAITSTAGWVRRMGYARWQKLHRIVYFSAAAGVIHYYLLVKSDIREPVMYGAILVVLMLYRVMRVWKKRPAPKPTPAVVTR